MPRSLEAGRRAGQVTSAGPMAGPRLRALARRLQYAGGQVRCPCCERSFGRFILGDYPTQVICPGCGSRPRHRLLWLYLREQVEPGLGEADVLHFAPERVLGERLRRESGRYVSADLSDDRSPTVLADITALPFEDAGFDLVLCSHVLEHVDDDGRAMREMCRVLRPGGAALIQSPVNHYQAQTFESAEVTTPEERARYFSQPDHVRVYGRDVERRLSDAGFTVSLYPPPAALDEEVAERFGLVLAHGPLRNEIYVCEAGAAPVPSSGGK